ncbi:nitroreductase [Candidatus Thorarchaeota archaeon]|nr:MAG: nitroreductase [Candidatus Thorarchaeota archaeon]
MEIPAESWYNSISLRHSQRKYSGEVPDESVTSGIEKVCTEFAPFPGVRSVLVREPANDVFKGAVGQYFFKVTKAPYYIAFIGDITKANIQASVGYTGEGIILEATALGLNTCWVGGFYKREAVLKQIDLKDNEQLLAITPIGYSLDGKDRVGNSPKKHRRKELNGLILSKEDNIGSWIDSTLEAARLAPSAANRQPWRFSISEDSITVSSSSNREGFGVSRRLDCGIAMLHLELGALVSGFKGSWEFLDYPEIARFLIH